MAGISGSLLAGTTAALSIHQDPLRQADYHSESGGVDIRVWLHHRYAATVSSDLTGTFGLGIEGRPRRSFPSIELDLAQTRERAHSLGCSTIKVDVRANQVELAADLGGVYPLFYAPLGDGWVFSTTVSQLKEWLQPPPDFVSVIHHLRTATVLGDTTVFVGIKRVLPGQRVLLKAGHSPQITEPSGIWVVSEQAPNIDQLIDTVWEQLTEAVGTLEELSPTVLMMSGGWDSRTLLAALSAAGSFCSGYTHGDGHSRELMLVRRLASSRGVALQQEEIDARCLSQAAVLGAFDRVESSSFPHWVRAGQRILDSGSGTSIMAGILGEVLGGHYGLTMAGSWSRRSIALVWGLLENSGVSHSSSPSARSVLYSPANIGPHWYLTRDFEQSLGALGERFNDGIDTFLRRHERRGVSSQSSLVEAFITEHRGAQYIAAQLRSTRASLPVLAPFGNPRLLETVSRVPVGIRLHNSLNRLMLRRYAPDLLRLPMAATLVPASMPIIVQEVSRAARKAIDTAWLTGKQLGITSGPRRAGWVNFEFLRSGHALRDLVDVLRLDIWDRVSLHQRITELADKNRATNPHSLFDQVMKIVTIDRLLS